jgi:hypothetical protein
MKKLILIAFLFAAFIAAGQEFPDVSGGESMTGVSILQPHEFSVGDTIVAYYETDTANYLAAMNQVKYANFGFMMSVPNATNKDHINGVPLNAEIKLGVVVNNDVFKIEAIEVTDIRGTNVAFAKASGLTVFYIREHQVTDEKVMLTEMPYLTWLKQQCPVFEINQHDAGEVIPSQVINLPVKIQYHAGWTVTLITGDGRIAREKYKPLQYFPTVKDIDRGYVNLIFNVTPLENCAIETSLFPYKIYLKSVTSTNTPNVEDLTKGLWNMYTKYYLDVSNKGREVTLKYEMKRPPWGHKPFPAIRVEFYGGTQFIPTKILYSVDVYDMQPYVSYEYPEWVTRGYVKIKTLFHDYEYSSKWIKF